tara:strand:+ start:67 stop:213 length:147 start_codon:yes stop_codon:yes gene_type:complete
MELQEKLENLTKQKNELEVHLIKIVGAIEMIQALIQEEPKKEKKKKEK